MSLIQAIVQKGKIIGRSCALAASLLSAPAYAESISPEAAPQHHHELSLSFSKDHNPSLEPLMLVNNAHTLESVLNEGLWSFKPSTFIGRLALLSVGIYGQTVVSTLPHELSHYQEERETGKKNIRLHFQKILILQPHGHYDLENGKSKEDMLIMGRAPAINTVVASDILTASSSLHYLQVLDALAYIVNHTYISAPVLDKQIYEFHSQRLYGEGTPKYLAVQKNIVGVSIFNALDPYTLYSFFGIGKYLATGNLMQALPSPIVPQLNGYLAVPEPLYEACWYVPWKEAVFSAALRAGNAVEDYAALRIGLKYVSWKNTEFNWLVEGIQNEDFGMAAHASVLFPIAGIKVGPTFSYKSEGVWTPFMNGLKERVVGGIGLKL